MASSSSVLLFGFGGKDPLWFGDRPLSLFCLSSVYLDVSGVTYLESLSIEDLDRFCLWSTAWCLYNRRRSIWARRLLAPASWLVGGLLRGLGLYTLRDYWFSFVCWLCCFGQLPAFSALCLYEALEVHPAFGIWGCFASKNYPRRSRDLFVLVEVPPSISSSSSSSS